MTSGNIERPIKKEYFSYFSEKEEYHISNNCKIFLAIHEYICSSNVRNIIYMIYIITYTYITISLEDKFNVIEVLKAK